MAYRRSRRTTGRRSSPARGRSRRTYSSRSAPRRSTRRVSRAPRQQTVRLVIQTQAMGTPNSQQVTKVPLKAMF